MPIHLISSTKVQQTHIAVWAYVGLMENKPLSVAINRLIDLYLIAYIDAVLIAQVLYHLWW